MAGARLSVKAARRLIEMKLIPVLSGRRNLSRLHHAVDTTVTKAGGVRWKSGRRQAPLLTAAPVRALIDEQIHIKGRFLPPHCPVTVSAQMHSEEGDLWEAFAHYNTNADGTVNLTCDRSVGGSYVGCEPMGLFWALQPAPGAREARPNIWTETPRERSLAAPQTGHRRRFIGIFSNNKIVLFTFKLRKKNMETPYIFLVSLLKGHVTPSERLSTELAAVTTERWYMAPGVQRIEIRENGIVGTLFLPPGPGPSPAMLDLWGMGGGLAEYRSALFASRGYASLSLAYFGHKDLPGPQNSINVGDSYFKSAFHLLQDHPQVCADRIGIFGLSFGVYLTLRIATQTGVKPSCLIGVNGPVGSTSKMADADGRTESFEIDQKYWTYDDQGHVIFRDVSLPSNLPPESKVKIEKLSCPLMYIVGEDDLSASSKENADLIEETLRAAGKSHLFTRLSYPGAGHLIEPPYAPNARRSLWSVKPEKRMTLWGGHPAPHAAAQEDAWKKILDFMEVNLRQ